MNKDMKFKILALVAILLIGMAAMASAANQGNVLFKNRYNTTSTTPIDDIDQLNGVTSNVQDQLDAGGTGTLLDASIFVGNGSNVATAVALTVSGDAVGTGDNTGDIAVALSTGSVDSDEIAANAVSQSELNFEELDFYVEVGNSNAIAVSTGKLMGQPYGMANIGDIGNDMINTVIYHTADIEIVINGTAAGDASHFRGMAIK